MQKRKTRIILDIWIARIGSAFGWVCLVFWAMMGLVGLADLGTAKDNIDRIMPFICIGLAALHYLLIRKMNTDPEQFNRICNVLSEYSMPMDYSSGMDEFFREHMKVIVADNAMQSLRGV